MPASQRRNGGKFPDVFLSLNPWKEYSVEDLRGQFEGPAGDEADFALELEARLPLCKSVLGRRRDTYPGVIWALTQDKQGLNTTQRRQREAMTLIWSQNLDYMPEDLPADAAKKATAEALKNEPRDNNFKPPEPEPAPRVVIFDKEGGNPVLLVTVLFLALVAVVIGWRVKQRPEKLSKMEAKELRGLYYQGHEMGRELLRLVAKKSKNNGPYLNGIHDILAVFDIEPVMMVMNDGAVMELGSPVTLGDVAGYIAEITSNEITIEGETGLFTIQIPSVRVMGQDFMTAFPITMMKRPGMGGLAVAAVCARLGLDFQPGDHRLSLFGYSEATSYRAWLEEIAPQLGLVITGTTVSNRTGVDIHVHIGYTEYYSGSVETSVARMAAEIGAACGWEITIDKDIVGISRAAVQFSDLVRGAQSYGFSLEVDAPNRRATFRRQT